MNLQRLAASFIVAVTAALLLGGATRALADDCGLLGGAVNGAGECEVASPVARTGTFNLDETLHVTGTGRIDASNASLAGITLNICVPPATPNPNCDLILDTPAPLVIPPAIGGGQIEADNIAGNNASPITIQVSRDVLMGANSAILAENVVSGGNGGNIAITTGRNLTMHAGATISVSGGGNSPGGSVGIVVGNYPNSPGVGVFTMDATSQVLANSPLASAGAIAISAGAQMDINGLVRSSSRLSGVANQPPGGGPITLVSACKLTVGDTGEVSSEGKDPGADLVHLEGCDVFIYGIVQSLVVLAGGHSLPTHPPNHCNLDTTAHPAFGPPSPPAAFPGRYTACVEIWANNVTIDATGTHHGEVGADGVRTDTGGPMRSWIDIFAKQDITIIASATGNYAVHANPDGATNDFGGLITIKSLGGKIAATALVPGIKGLAMQANDASGGGRGGDVIVQAGGASPIGQVDFTADSVQAAGATSGGAPAGGHISVQSFNDTILGIAPGELDAAGGGIVGTVSLTACVGDPATTYAGTVTGTKTTGGPGVCGGSPTFPAVAHFVTGLAVTDFFTNRQGLWDACALLTPSLNKAFGPASFQVGGFTTLTFTISNPAGSPAQSNVGFVDNLPSGLRIANPNGVGAGTCVNAAAATIAVAGLTTITVAGLQVPAGAASCTVAVNVTNKAGQVNPECGTFPAAFTNAGAVNATGVNNVSGLVGVTDAITQSCVMVTPLTPTLTKSFSPTIIDSGGITTLTFTVTNPAGNPALSNADFVDTLPSGLQIANPNGLGASTCANAATAAAAVAGQTTITVAGLQVPAGAASCTVTVNVTNKPGQLNADCASNPVAFTNGPGNVSVTNVNNGVVDSCVVVNALTFSFGITKTPSTGTVAPGQALSFTAVVTNNGPGAADGAIITDPAIPFYTANAVTCVGTTGGASCPSPLTVVAMQGAGMTVATYPAGATITLRIDGTSSLVSGQLLNTVTVSPPPGITGVASVSATAAVSPQVGVIPTLSLNALIALMLLVGLGTTSYFRKAKL